MTVLDRFNAKWMPEPNCGCWLWTGSVNGKGYGKMRLGGAAAGYALAHRISWELHRGAIGVGLMVCHRCDNPACVNPDHLFLGTAFDNMQDCAAKGRVATTTQPRGEKHLKAKLTAADVELIRETAPHMRGLAARYGVTRSTINRARRKATWASVP